MAFLILGLYYEPSKAAKEFYLWQVKSYTQRGLFSSYQILKLE